MLVGLWAGATGLAVGIATAGVNLVANQVTEPIPVVLATPGQDGGDVSTGSVGDGASDAASSPTDPTPSPSLTPSASESPATMVSDAPRSSPSGGSTPSASPASSPSTTESPTPTASDAPTEGDGPGRGRDDQAGEPETRSASTIGGRAGFRFADGDVELLWASPNQGFEVEVTERRDDRIIVQFSSPDHVSTIVARFNGAEARIETDEDENDD